MNKDRAIIVFVKNPVIGNCKRRLAKRIGDQNALHVYNQLLDYTASFVQKLKYPVFVYYSDFIKEEDYWINRNVFKHQQNGEDLGIRMLNAFDEVLKLNFSNVLIIGSDCAQIDESDLEKAFEKLATNDVVIGPATDGGYYLLAMKGLISDIFKNIEWSNSQVFDTTLHRLNQLNKTVFLLDEKSDLDEFDDLFKPMLIDIHWKAN